MIIMAENQLIHRNDRIRVEARETDWGTLLGRAVDDITRILHSESRLVMIGLKTMFDEEVDRVMAFALTGVLMATSLMCVLAAAILFLHEYALLPWWQSFGIVGLALFALAIGVGGFASSRPKPPAPIS
jgi:hypothetical protein